MLDITERKQAEEELRNSEERLKILFESAPDGYFLIDIKGNIVDANKAAEEIIGIEREEFIGRNFAKLKLLAPGQALIVAKNIAEFVLGHSDRQSEFVFNRRDGQQVTVEVSSTLVKVKGKTLVLGITRDITERKQAEEELRNSEEKFRLLFKNIPDGVYQSTPEGKILTANHAFIRMLGYDSEEDLKCINTASDLYANPEEREAVNQKFINEGEVRNAELVLSCKDGRHITALLNAHVVRDTRGKVLYYEGTLTDITKRKKMENELIQSEKMRAIGSLAAGIAHEINSPMQFIGSNLRFLRKSSIKVMKIIKDVPESDTLEYEIENVPKAIEQSLEGVDRITEIIQAMRAFSHPGEEKRAPIDLNEAIRNTTTVVRSEWKYAAELILQLDPNLPPVPCISGEINQVLLILVVNAAQAISEESNKLARTEKGTITISTRLEKDNVIVSIADTGTGIPPEIQPRIFEPFFTTKEVGKGTGQGLSIAHAIIVEKHGGLLTFETEEGKGTTIFVHLPIN